MKYNGYGAKLMTVLVTQPLDFKFISSYSSYFFLYTKAYKGKKLFLNETTYLINTLLSFNGTKTCVRRKWATSKDTKLAGYPML